MKILYLPNQYAQQRQHEKKRWIWPVHLAMEATYMRNQGHHVYWDQPEFQFVADKIIRTPQGLPFLELPVADRILTNAFNKRYQRNGNFKHHPGTYIQSASGCWWGKCTFCKECGKKYELRPVDDVIAEIKECKELGFKEVFDDAASLAVGEWRVEFIQKLRPLDITFSCNMRFGTLKGTDFLALKNAGFRMLLYGLESANQKTLDKVNKGINRDDAIYELMLASRYGIENHIAAMFGLPDETDEDAIRTLKLVHFLLRKGYAKTAQASLYTTQSELPNFRHKKYVSQIYHAAYYPDFWLTKILDIHNIDDLKYIWRGIKAWFGI